MCLHVLPCMTDTFKRSSTESCCLSLVVLPRVLHPALHVFAETLMFLKNYYCNYCRTLRSARLASASLAQSLRPIESKCQGERSQHRHLTQTLHVYIISNAFVQRCSHDGRRRHGSERRSRLPRPHRQVRVHSSKCAHSHEFICFPPFLNRRALEIPESPCSNTIARDDALPGTAAHTPLQHCICPCLVSAV
jgi:hypothetical protein